MDDDPRRATVVLVHGSFVDGSGWRGVYDALRAGGYTVAGYHRMVRSLAGSFAADLPRAEAEFLAGSQVPWGLDALHGQVSEPAWRTRPAWYLVAGNDRVIPPPAQRAMAGRIGARTVEVPGGSHFVYLCQPAAVAGL